MPLLNISTFSTNVSIVEEADLEHALDSFEVPVIDADVDGTNSEPARIDSDKPVLGQRSVTKRLARTVFFGAAPTIGTAHKGIDTQRTQALLPMLRRAPHVVLMSGTPLGNACAQDVYPLLQAMCGNTGAMPSLSLWNERYCHENRQIFTGYRSIDRWVGVSEEHAAELHNLLSRVMVRKRKEEVFGRDVLILHRIGFGKSRFQDTLQAASCLRLRPTRDFGPLLEQVLHLREKRVNRNA